MTNTGLATLDATITADGQVWFQRLDLEVYDGGDGWSAPFNAVAEQVGLYYYDADGNGSYTPGEDIWRDGFSVITGEYDDGLDTQLWDGADGWTSVDNVDGAQNSLFYNDADGSGVYTIGEDIWRDELAPVTRQYDVGIDLEIYDGGDGWTTLDNAAGEETPLWYYDQDASGHYTLGEDIWRDEPAVSTAFMTMVTTQ